jgi:hypothetical protein
MAPDAVYYVVKPGCGHRGQGLLAGQIDNSILQPIYRAHIGRCIVIKCILPGAHMYCVELLHVVHYRHYGISADCAALATAPDGVLCLVRDRPPHTAAVRARRQISCVTR